MTRRFLRAALFAGVVLALWALARPASAAWAPLCDDRGATVLAPPPTLEAPDVAVTRARASCDSGDDVLSALLQRAGHDRAGSIGGAQPGLPGAPPRVARDRGPRVVVPSFVADRPQGGVRFRVERPPRG